MQLDVLTLVAMGSFVSASAGAILLVAWSQSRNTPALALWGLANVVSALGIACLMAGSAVQQPAISQLGAALLTLSAGLIWKAARAFDAKTAPFLLALLGAAIVAVAAAIPAAGGAAILLNLGLSAGYLLAAAITLWLGRKERLNARWPIVILTAIHGLVLLTGLYSRLTGALDADAIPALMSLFGLIHFENIVFNLGTAVFILALVKERSEAASETAARIDPLTGIANRAAFMERAAEGVERCRRENVPVSVMMCDLDGFKSINDTHGHAAGDAVIQRFCEVVTDALWPNDIFGRIGGEEFAIVFPRASIEAACVRAERIRILFAESCCVVEGRKIDATVSCGLSVSADAGQTLSALLRLSDMALYRAKAEGRNRVKRADHPAHDSGPSSVIRVA